MKLGLVSSSLVLKKERERKMKKNDVLKKRLNHTIILCFKLSFTSQTKKRGKRNEKKQKTQRITNKNQSTQNKVSD